MAAGFPFEADQILIDDTDPAIPVVSLNRPRRRNAVTFAMWRELGHIFTRLGQRPEVRAIVLTGTGGAFSAGADISEFPEVRATAEDGHAYEAAADLCQTSILNCPKATIAAIDGACFGGGVGIALACDFRIASPSAYFAIPAARLSNVYGIIETRSLLNAVGLVVAKEVLFTGKRYSAEEALRTGLATGLCDSDAVAAAKAYAAPLKTAAPLTIKGAKIVLDALANAEIEKRHDAIEAVMAEALNSADYKEGVKAFAEKRDPKFTGR